jgi:hypothetical protein
VSERDEDRGCVVPPGLVLSSRVCLLMALCPICSRKAAQLNVLRISGICYIIRISCQIFYYKVSEDFFQERILQHLN